MFDASRTTLLRVSIRISNADDPRLADYRDLRDVRARRVIEGDELFIAEGPVAIERLLASGHRVRSVLLSETKWDRLAPLLDGRDGFEVFVADPDVLRVIVGFDLHRGAIAAADRLPARSVDSVIANATRLAMVEGVNDPENIGLLMRSASALFIDGLILDPTAFDPYTRRSVRVSMGEALHVPFARTNADEWPTGIFEQLRTAGFESWAMTPADDAMDIWDLAPPPQLAMVFGAEGPGLRPATLAATDRRVRLPIKPQVDSLNLAASAAATFAITNRRMVPGTVCRG